MTEDTHDEHMEETAAVSEPSDNQPQEHQEEQKMVPLAALQAERRKRQDLESRARVYEEMMAKKSTEPEEEEDLDALVTKGSFQHEKALTKREILEQVYQDMNPGVVQKIGDYLKPILDKKPWLAASLDNAMNRLARANEIVDDYMHLLDEKPKTNKVSSTGATDARRIVENAQKPRSPQEIAKSAQLSGVELLKGMQGKKEFREYRAKILRGEI